MCLYRGLELNCVFVQRVRVVFVLCVSTKLTSQRRYVWLATSKIHI